MNKKEKGKTIEYLVFFLVFAIIFAIGVKASASGSNGSALLSIFTNFEGQTPTSNVNLTFYANFTNTTIAAINATNGNGLCQISFNLTGAFNAFTNMTYNGSVPIWNFTRSFNYKGRHQYMTNCTSIYGNITIADNFTISNSPPTISTEGDFVDLDGSALTSPDYLSCTEDTLCLTFNFSNRTQDADINDALTFNYSTSSNTTLNNFTLDGSTGILVINITESLYTGLKKIELNVRDNEPSAAVAAILNVNITEVNDAPSFVNLQNQTFNISALLNYIIYGADEENNVPFSFNISFINCSVAEWSTRNCSDSAGVQLFNTSQYSFNGSAINISFTPQRNDVGNYQINFTIKDLNNNVTPFNNSFSQLVNFQVTNLNEAPSFRYVCNNERNATEGSPFLCQINVTDLDETNNLTITANETWFTFNGTGTNTLTKRVNSSTVYNATFLVNMTADDNAVGNWSINISVRDTGSPLKLNSTIITFYVANINDSVSISPISNLTAFTTNNYTIYANATDNDLLIPDKSIYNESLQFFSNLSWVTITRNQTFSGTNITQAVINVYPNLTFSGKNYVNISVRDANNYSISSTIFVINVTGNNIPVWNTSLMTNYSLTEGTNFYLNLTANVTDGDNDPLTFVFTNSTEFYSFAIGSATGIINITPLDNDVGYHQIYINASDGKVSVPLVFNFTVANIPDNPYITPSLQGNGISINMTASSANTTEDATVDLILWAEDEDLKIPSGQKTVYNESLWIYNLTIVGPNTALFNLTRDNSFPSTLFPNRTKFTASFTPNHSDLGNFNTIVYNITINVSDQTNRSAYISFNLSITSTAHAPVLSALTNYTASILETFFLDINATDVEDGNETNLNLTYVLANLTSRGNFLTINQTSGIINKSLNQTFAGFWKYNITVNDTSGKQDSKLFNITIYDYPYIISPASNIWFNLTENSAYPFNFTVNSTVGSILNETLTYRLYLDGILVNTTNGNGNGTIFSWSFTPNYTDSNCMAARNLTLNVSNAKLSNSTTWNLTINQTNNPTSFSGSIGGVAKALSASDSVTVSLNDYFSDVDATDRCINQTIGFSYNLISGTASGGTITVSIINWTTGSNPSVNFSASENSSANYSITSFEYGNGSSLTSNNFSVSLSVSTPESIPSPGSSTSGGGGGGSGGGGTGTQPVLLKLVLPHPVSAFTNQKIVLPITLSNEGVIDLNSITLSNVVAKDGVAINDVTSSFDVDHISFLAAGESKDVTLTIDLDTAKSGLYEITVNASVADPAYTDWGKIYLNVKENNTLEEKTVFIDELLVANPECKEISEIVDTAKAYRAQGKNDLAEQKIDEAINACKQAIAQKPNPRKPQGGFDGRIFLYLGIAMGMSIIFGLVYYNITKMNFKR